MPVWKVFDEKTASELRSRLEGNSSIELLSRGPSIDSGNAVILAPTAYPGVTMLITARRKSEPVLDHSIAATTEKEIVDQPIYAEAPAISETPLEVEQNIDFWESPTVKSESTYELGPNVEAQLDSASITPAAEEPLQHSPVEEPAKSSVVEDDFFGPTTWERIESAELEALPEDPLVFESELSAAPRFEPTIEPPPAPRVQAPEPRSPINRPATQLPAAPVESPRPPAERHYVATGFLGLDETVEDEEDIAREKRPWWKKMFLD